MAEPTPFPLSPVFVPDPTAQLPAARPGGFSDPKSLVPPARSALDASIKEFHVARDTPGSSPLTVGEKALGVYGTYVQGIFSAEIDEPGQGMVRTKGIEKVAELAVPGRFVKTLVGTEGGIPLLGNRRAGQLNRLDEPGARTDIIPTPPARPVQSVADATASIVGGGVVSSGQRTYPDTVAVPLIGAGGGVVGFRGVELPPITAGRPSPLVPVDLVGAAVNGSIGSVLAGRGSDAPSNGPRDNANRPNGGNLPPLAVTADP